MFFSVQLFFLVSLYLAENSYSHLTLFPSSFETDSSATKFKDNLISSVSHIFIFLILYDIISNEYYKGLLK